MILSIEQVAIREPGGWVHGFCRLGPVTAIEGRVAPKWSSIMSNGWQRAAAVCAKVILLMVLFAALHPRCAAQRTHDISGAWEVSGGSCFLAKTHLCITMQMAGPPKAVLYAAYDNP